MDPSKAAYGMGENTCKSYTKRGLISKLYEELLQFKSEKQITQLKMSKGNRYFFKENIQVAKRHVKKFSTSLITRDNQVKTTIRYHIIPVRMAVIKKKKTENNHFG